MVYGVSYSLFIWIPFGQNQNNRFTILAEENLLSLHFLMLRLDKSILAYSFAGALRTG
jgi:hypothetical protein